MAAQMDTLDGTSIVGTTIAITSLTLSNIFTESNLRALMYAVTIVAAITTILVNIQKLKKK
jgi:hypothetical protein